MHQIYQDWHIALTDIDDQDKISICSRHKNIAILSDTNMCISSSPEIMKIMKVNTLKNTAKGARSSDWVYVHKYDVTWQDKKISVFTLPSQHLDPDSILRNCLDSIGNPIMEIRRSYDRLISTMRFPILVRRPLYFESGPDGWPYNNCFGSPFSMSQVQNNSGDTRQYTAMWIQLKNCVCLYCMMYCTLRELELSSNL